MQDWGDLWVFGYGSLMWQPGFSYAECGPATLAGWRRSFCLRSVRYRGTPEAPGLVLGLDAEDGALCHGVAFRVAAPEAEGVRAYLRERELVTYAYAEVMLPVTLRSGRSVAALTYVIDRSHPQYAGILAPEDQAAIIARAVGPSGSNRAYLESTLAHLAEADIADPALEHVGRLVAALG
jgi:cation transport protein ChaC